MCILVSASDQATAAPEAPAPMISTSTGSFIEASPPALAASGRFGAFGLLDDRTIGSERPASKAAVGECRTSRGADHWCCDIRMLENGTDEKIDSEPACPSKSPLPPPA